jgi:hypothetical protein
MRAASGMAVVIAATGIVFLGVAIISATAMSQAQAQVPVGACRLLELGSDRLASEECLVCHKSEHCHPVEVVYVHALARQILRGGTFLRSEDEAVGRGAYLPDGRVRCVTCHDRHSRAGSYIAFPASSVADQGIKPLCLECHPRE